MDTSNSFGRDKSPARRSRIWAAAVVDLLIPSLTIICLLAVLDTLVGAVPRLLSPALGVLALLYVLLAQRGLVFSVGGWGLGLRRRASSGEASRIGVVVEDVSDSALSRRTIVLGAYFGAVILILSVLSGR
jgi:hypothetical protein